ncbi:PfkB family carbohydrate kinase [Pseudorhodoferax sp.]|uniref:PfkB family carbohydrate kinase n=1 Tax=Pseudorhodoferax sp. TaxID=1993553 RepID=UPI002DD67A77|nr:PfkB family carbohydrate kinase [Pseudorhodoferax sp.]
MTPDDLRSRLEAKVPTLVCIGLTAYDLTWDVEHLPRGGGKTRALNFRQGGGGMAANAAAAAARLGARVCFWGRAGDDMAGQQMVHELHALGVDVSALRLFAGARSSVSGIAVDAAGERSIVNFRGAGLPDDADWLPLDTLARCDAVLGDVRWPAGVAAAFDAARAAGIPTVLDGDVAEAAVFDTLLPRSDYAVFSEPGLAGYAPGLADDEARLRHALARGCRLAAVTRGAGGVVWTDGGTLQGQPAFAVEAVDTTGAGDVFHGALALALGVGADVADAFRFASAVAALKCTQPGGRAGVPGLARVLEALDELKEA